MSTPPLPFYLNPEEPIIKQGEATYLRSTFTGIGYNPMPGFAWVTNNRLIWSSTARRHQLGMDYSPVTFPIQRIAAIDILPMKVQWSDQLVVRLMFDNGGKEYFVFAGGPDAWVNIMQQAKPLAMPMVYQTTPTTRPGVEGAVKRSWLFLGALIVGIPIVCGGLCLLLTVIAQFLPD